MRYQIGHPEKCKVSQKNCSLKDKAHVQVITLLNNLDEKRGFDNSFQFNCKGGTPCDSLGKVFNSVVKEGRCV